MTDSATDLPALSIGGATPVRRWSRGVAECVVKLRSAGAPGSPCRVPTDRAAVRPSVRILVVSV